MRPSRTTAAAALLAVLALSGCGSADQASTDALSNPGPTESAAPTLNPYSKLGDESEKLDNNTTIYYEKAQFQSACNDLEDNKPVYFEKDDEFSQDDGPSGACVKVTSVQAQQKLTDAPHRAEIISAGQKNLETNFTGKFKDRIAQIGDLEQRVVNTALIPTEFGGSTSDLKNVFVGTDQGVEAQNKINQEVIDYLKANPGHSVTYMALANGGSSSSAYNRLTSDVVEIDVVSDDGSFDKRYEVYTAGSDLFYIDETNGAINPA